MPGRGDAKASETLPFPGTRRLRTDDWPEHSRAAMFREQFGGDRIRVEPLPGHPLYIDVLFARFPGLRLVWGRRSPLKSEFRDGGDRLLFNPGSAAVATQFGREVELAPGDAVALSGADSGAFVTLATGPIITLEFPTGSLVQSLGDARMSCMQSVRRDEPALRLLRTYLRSILAMGTKASPSVRTVAAAHMLDLASLALGPSRQSAELATVRTLPTARLQAIKDDILAELGSDISVDDIARRHSLSPRYIRMLFEGEGTTFSEFVRDERLKRARRLLLSARQRAIGDIAFSVGFNDLSYFNRSFRRRFGCSPREMRDAQAQLVPHQ